jgi:hypothetical protein
MNPLGHELNFQPMADLDESVIVVSDCQAAPMTMDGLIAVQLASDSEADCTSYAGVNAIRSLVRSK